MLFNKYNLDSRVRGNIKKRKQDSEQEGTGETPLPPRLDSQFD